MSIPDAIDTIPRSFSLLLLPPVDPGAEHPVATRPIDRMIPAVAKTLFVRISYSFV